MINYPTYSVEMQKKNVDVIRLGTVMKRDEVLQILRDIGVIGSPVNTLPTGQIAQEMIFIMRAKIIRLRFHTSKMRCLLSC